MANTAAGRATKIMNREMKMLCQATAGRREGKESNPRAKKSNICISQEIPSKKWTKLRL